MTSDKKIKVLFRHRSMEMGGVEKVMLSILNNLDRNKFEMTVCLTLNQGELRNEIPKHVRKIYLTEGKEDFSSNPIVKNIRLILRRLKLRKLKKSPSIVDDIINDTFDVEIGMDYRDYDSILSSSNKNSKKIGWFHSEINVPKLKPIVPQILTNFPKFDYMVYCSQRIKDMMHQYYPNLKYPHEAVIVNAIPINEIKEKAEEKIDSFPNHPTFISIGRLHSRKGFHKLIDAHTKLIKEGLQHNIIVLGNGEEMENLQKQIKANSVEKSFILAGNKMNPYPYIKNADYFILPSESEAWPLVIAEALILKKPTIATNVGDIGLMIKDKKTGYLINYKTSDIYSAMKEFLTNPQLIDDIRENLKNIDEQFDSKKIFNEIEKTIINLVEVS